MFTSFVPCSGFSVAMYSIVSTLLTKATKWSIICEWYPTTRASSDRFDWYHWHFINILNIDVYCCCCTFVTNINSRHGQFIDWRCFIINFCIGKFNLTVCGSNSKCIVFFNDTPQTTFTIKFTLLYNFKHDVFVRINIRCNDRYTCHRTTK